MKLENPEQTKHVKLVAKNTDWEGYTSYVFENLHPINEDDKYIMCVMFPNWNQTIVSIGEIGFVSVKLVIAGVDTWYNGKDNIPYKYTNLIFCKFIKEEPMYEEIILD